MPGSKHVAIRAFGDASSPFLKGVPPSGGPHLRWRYDPKCAPSPARHQTVGLAPPRSRAPALSLRVTPSAWHHPKHKSDARLRAVRRVATNPETIPVGPDFLMVRAIESLGQERNMPRVDNLIRPYVQPGCGRLILPGADSNVAMADSRTLKFIATPGGQ